MRIAFLRHGPTDWNAIGRVQGHTDIPLSEAGRTLVASRALPDDLVAPRLFVSTLCRTQQTAQLLGLAPVIADARLMEQNWGLWEGLTHAEILARDGDDALTRAGFGAGFLPPGGESTGEVIARVQAFLTDAAVGEGDVVAVAHLGVLRAAYVIATGWGMDAPMPPALDAAKILVLTLARGGEATLAALNRDFSRRA